MTLRKFLYASCCLGMLCATAALPARGQTLPGPAEPSRQTHETIPVSPGMEEYDLPVVPPRASAQVPGNIASVRFILNDLTIDGATAYSPAQLRPYYAAQLGKQISVSDLYQIMVRIQQRYLNDGFTFTKVSIPEQNLEGGHIKFSVVEGYVGEVEFEKKPLASPLIDNAVARLKAMRPLNVHKLERLVLIMNDLPDMHIGAIIAPPTDKNAPPGELRIVFRVLMPEDKVTHGVVSVDNGGSRYVGPWRANLQGKFNSIIVPYNQISYQAAVAKPLPELSFFGLGYALPLFGASGAQASVNASMSRSRPGSRLKDLDIVGRTANIAASISFPIVLQRDRTFTVNGTFDAMNADTDLLSDRLYKDRLRSVRIGTNYTFSDRFFGLNTATMLLSKGLDILGMRKSGSPDLSRPAGRTDYTKLNATVSRYQTLPWNMGFYARAEGQYTRNPLLASEEFGFGGEPMGRGYDPSEILGDKGVAMVFELNKTFKDEANKLILQPYIFYDISRVWNIDPGAADKISAASAGGGLRAGLNGLWSCNTAVAVPLTKKPNNPPPYAGGKQPRFLITLTRKF